MNKNEQIRTYTPPKTNMDTENDGLEKGDSLKIWPFLISMLDLWGVVCIILLHQPELI